MISCWFNNYLFDHLSARVKPVLNGSLLDQKVFHGGQNVRSSRDLESPRHKSTHPLTQDKRSGTRPKRTLDHELYLISMGP